MLTTKTLVPIPGVKSIQLGADQLEPSAAILLAMVVGTPYNIVLSNGFLECVGTATKQVDGTILFEFKDTLTAPSGACIVFDINEITDDEKCGPVAPVDFSNLEDTEKDALRFAILDENDCPLLTLTLGELKEYILRDIPKDACDLFLKDDTGAIITTDITATDRIASLPEGECKLTAVTPGSLCC